MDGHATSPEKKRHKKGTALRIIDRLTSKNKAKVSMHGYFLSQRKVNETSIKYSITEVRPLKRVAREKWGTHDALRASRPGNEVVKAADVFGFL